MVFSFHVIVRLTFLPKLLVFGVTDTVVVIAYGTPIDVTVTKLCVPTVIEVLFTPSPRR